MAEIELKTIETVSNQPFRKLVTTIGELPSAFIESMSYYEMLAWMVNWLETTVIPAVNNNAEAVKELQDLFVELKTFVDTYFENLDVQEEINNKLDAMVEAGTLQEIIADYLNSRAVFGFDTVADMKAATNLINGSYARTLGYYSKNDGGGALFKIRTITNDDTIDETTIYEMENDDTLIAELIIDETMNVKQFGVKADGTTDNTAKLNAIISLGYPKLYFPDGEYKIDSRIDISSIYEIEGQTRSKTIIKALNGFNWSARSGKILHNFTLDGVSINNETYNTGLEGILAFGKLENVSIKNYYIGFKPLTGSWINNFDNIYISYCTNGIYNNSISTFNDNTFVNCVFQHISNDCINISGDVNNFIGCDFEFSHYCFNRSGRLLNIDKCYIEGNDRIINVNEASFQSEVFISNSWLLAPSALNVTNGWLACLFKVTSYDTTTASLSINNCEIRNVVKDTIKPFSFQGNGNKSYWGINLENNSYYDIKTSSSYKIYYSDLIDFTTCTDYGKTGNSITFHTDLPLYKFNGIYAFRKSLGNKMGALSSNQLMELKGHYAVEQSNSVIEITPDYKFVNLYPQLNNIPVMIRFSDNTIDFARMSVDGNKFYIYPNYNSRTTAEVIFDCSYINQ